VLSKTDRFDDVIAWQKARELTRAISQVTQQGAFAKDFGLCQENPKSCHIDYVQYR
jgi:hypothetical protein